MTDRLFDLSCEPYVGGVYEKENGPSKKNTDGKEGSV